MKQKTKDLLASLLRLLLALLSGAAGERGGSRKATKCGFVPERGEDSALSDGGKNMLG